MSVEFKKGDLVTALNGPNYAYDCVSYVSSKKQWSATNEVHFVTNKRKPILIVDRISPLTSHATYMLIGLVDERFIVIWPSTVEPWIPPNDNNDST